ncbi:PAS-domain containing protein [Tropicimonas isoalkanivorans]|uniref:PAS fold n=1 Tax=Tropicimonas isoalkanivorans TaxID=441112 RepID=A0A1I1MEY3_9RHOB|nr:PAS-domain containing protein [Tropicimonas isoalkanivorans]SFC81628.1 PAS fold [Tropicimonas isoalkanivorans]
MGMFDLSLGLVLVVSSFGTAAVALYLMGHLMPSRKVSWTPIEQMGERVVFLFRDKELVDATPDARALLETGAGFLEEWPRLIALLEDRFPSLAVEIGKLGEAQWIELTDPETGDRVEAEWRGGLARIVLISGTGAQAGAREPDRLHQEALASELKTLRGVVDDAPMLVWKEDATGAVRWANAAYVNLVRRISESPGAIGWPLPRLFDQRPIGPDMAEPPRRLSITVPNCEEPLWFDSYDEAQEDDTLIFALPADKLVKAETSLREFVQTLTKTFAHLPTGLAVFDRKRRLALFNPALTDLSGLEPVFLSSRPSLFEFLDQLRDSRRMPEPKNYKTWRRQITDLESAASTGTYQETWYLPSGQTFRVTGRPHPDGALAFLFEDISAEIALTRRFRSELELGQSVLDAVDEAIAVFSSAGVMILSNRAYREMWDHDPDASLADTGVVQATALWQTLCHPTPVWGDLRDFVGDGGERAEWTAEVRRLDGKRLTCRFTPLTGHATLVGFSHVQSHRSLASPSKIWVKVPATGR